MKPDCKNKSIIYRDIDTSARLTKCESKVAETIQNLRDNTYTSSQVDNLLLGINNTIALLDGNTYTKSEINLQNALINQAIDFGDNIRYTKQEVDNFVAGINLNTSLLDNSKINVSYGMENNGLFLEIQLICLRSIHRNKLISY